MIKEENGVITIGNANGGITISENGAIIIFGRTLNIIGNEGSGGRLIETNIKSVKISLGDVDGDFNKTRIVIDDEQGSIDLSASGNTSE